MRILLINANREQRPYPVAPLGIACVAQALEREGHEVTLLDLTFARGVDRMVAQAVERSQPEWIGLSLRNLDNSSLASPYSYLREMEEIASCCRRASGSPLVLGGPAVSLAPRALLRRLGADYAVFGEGEEAAVELSRALGTGTEPGHVRGVVCIRAPAGPLQPARTGVSPGLTALLRHVDLQPYRRAGAPVPVQTRRGCAFRCAYCTYPSLEGSTYRTAEPAEVAEGIAAVARSTGHRAFEFVDSTFNAPLAFASEVCTAISRLPIRLHLLASGFTPASCSPELLAEMRRAGFRTLVSSPDSASDPVLEAMGKGFGREDLERAVDQVHEAGLAAMWSFLFGGPGETEATARETLQFIARRLTRRDVVFVAAGVRIYPGTPLEELARRQGLIGPEEDLLAPRFYLSPQLPLERLRALFAEYVEGARNVIFISDLQRGVLPWLARAMAAIGVAPPLWRFAPYLRRVPHSRSRVLP